MNNEEAYLVGYTKGDGCLYSYKHRFALNPEKILNGYEITWGDADVAQLKMIEKIVKNRFPDILIRMKIRNSRDNILRCWRKKVFVYIKNLMSIDIEQEPLENIADFLSGFCDAEADTSKTRNGPRMYENYQVSVNITQKDREILEKIKKILEERFGIKSYIHKKWRQNAFVLSIVGNKRLTLFKEKINFKNPTKKEKFESLLSAVYSRPKL
jgi:intein-encoded DNA endonuclease-like protein